MVNIRNTFFKFVLINLKKIFPIFLALGPKVETRNFFDATYTDCVTGEKISEDGHSAEASETVAEHYQRRYDLDEMSFKKHAIWGNDTVISTTSRLFPLEK